MSTSILQLLEEFLADTEMLLLSKDLTKKQFQKIYAYDKQEIMIKVHLLSPSSFVWSFAGNLFLWNGVITLYIYEKKKTKQNKKQTNKQKQKQKQNKIENKTKNKTKTKQNKTDNKT